MVIVNSNCYHGYSIEDALKRTHELGFTYVELTATKGWTEHVFPTMTFKELLRIKDLLAMYNLKIPAMSGHCNLMDYERLQDFVDNIHLAHFFGAEIIVSSIGEAHLEDKKSQGNKGIVRNIKTLIPHLDRYDMTLVLEVHGEHGTGSIINEIVELVDHPRVKIAYDTANAIFYGDVNILEDIKLCVHNIAYMHIKDKAGAKREWNFPAIGEGIVPFDKVFEILDETRNNCSVSIEIEFTDKGPSSIQMVDEALRISRDTLIKLGVI